MCNYYFYSLSPCILKTEDGSIIIIMSTPQIVRIVEVKSSVGQTGESTRHASRLMDLKSIQFGLKVTEKLYSTLILKDYNIMIS